MELYLASLRLAMDGSVMGPVLLPGIGAASEPFPCRHPYCSHRCYRGPPVEGSAETLVAREAAKKLAALGGSDPRAVLQARSES